MIQVLSGVWALLAGMVFIMIGNGMHFTLIGLRGGIEGFSSGELAVVTSGYFLGFLSGARLTPGLIRRVGHVRVFAALGSFMSAGLIAFPLITEPWAWTPLRILVGFCMSGVYVTAESWLNNAATNQTRGKLLSAYMLCQTLGIIAAQGLLTVGDAAGSALFIGASIMVSLSFGPILLSVQPAPAAELAKPMGPVAFYVNSPLAAVGIFLLGGIYAAVSGMSAVYGSQIGMGVSQIALFVAMTFAGSLVLQYPIGWLSDRIDRRLVILGSALFGAASCGLGYLAWNDITLLMGAAFLMGGVVTPLYALIIAYTNDNLDPDDMPAASGALVFFFGLGAILGPLLTGAVMEIVGPAGFWLVIMGLFAAITGYAGWRMTQRPGVPVEETESYLGVLPTSSPVALEAAGIWAADTAEAEQEAADQSS